MNYSAVIPINIAPAGLLLIATIVLVGCGEIHPVGSDFGPVRPGTEAAQPASLTPHERAAQDCWVETEHGAKGMPLDKRAKLSTSALRTR